MGHAAGKETESEGARAVLRSGLWEPLPPGVLATVPTAGAMLEALTDGAIAAIAAIGAIRGAARAPAPGPRTRRRLPS